MERQQDAMEVVATPALLPVGRGLSTPGEEEDAAAGEEADAVVYASGLLSPVVDLRRSHSIHGYSGGSMTPYGGFSLPDSENLDSVGEEDGLMLPLTSLERSSSAPTASTSRRQHRSKVERAAGKLVQRSPTQSGLSTRWQDARAQKVEKSAEELTFLASKVKQHGVSALVAEGDAAQIVDGMECYGFESGATLVSQGEIGRYFSIVRSGSVDIVLDGEVLSTLRRGGCFGGSSLLFDTTRRASVVAKEDTEVWATDGVAFRKMLAAQQTKRNEEHIAFLESIKLFDGLASEEKAKIKTSLPLFSSRFEGGDIVIVEGVPTQSMCVVRSGALDVVSGGRLDGQGGLEGGQIVGQLKVGDSFGKGAALYNMSKNRVSIVAASPCELICADLGALRDVLGENLSRTLERSLIHRCLDQSIYLSLYSNWQKRHIVNAMDIWDLQAGQEMPGSPDFVLVVQGDMVDTSDDEDEPIWLHRSQLAEAIGLKVWEEDGGKVVKRLSRRRLTAKRSVSSKLLAKDQLQGLVAGPKGARIATFTMERLKEVLKDLGISCSTEESIESARRMLLAKKVPLFHQLSRSQIETVVQSLIFVRLEKDALVFESSATATDFWVVVSGEVVVRRNGGGNGAVHTTTVGRYGCFGVEAIMSQEDTIHNACAIVTSKEAELWQLERDTFDDLIKGDARKELEKRFQLAYTPVELRGLRHIKVIGKGSFGSVRRVERGSAPHLVYALKRVRKRQASGKVMEWLQRECALLAEFDHPLIVQLVRTFETDDSMYILTELLTGGELLAALDKIAKCLTRPQAQFYSGSLLIALEYLHDRAIVFRDLKPENVMLDSDGYVKLIDFGTAKKLKDTDSRTFTIIGSFQFMAPEVWRGRGYGTKVDIWSLGVMLYEFVCGYLPFGRELQDPTAVQICRTVQASNLVFPERFSDAECKYLIRGMLRKDDESRLRHEDVRQHGWFRHHDHPQSIFDMLLEKKLDPPLVPPHPDSAAGKARQNPSGGCGSSDEALSDSELFLR
eukprot:TRINITY_DN32925_c0_g1_i2.p1 TRINITY_DN32925_c0_g1~~TRINITY_DN32925_c0_g1_i2.p1  ORF type:complete len:1015 (-),score=290.45 TRINITY_DN32925_c0_g1_i2:43-3087(-)